ncbi:MAG TPA: pirin family protein [Saprospiraceae bacterium]|nr:pirin family protein [Lewinellaceae bacterium]HQU52239.1 pirin family protein [Saprospiraceae bacterium]HRV85869.1 pirin family protein [Saprospiraceae bacterium]
MATRSVEAIIRPGSPHYVGDGFRVHNFIPGNQGASMQRMNPFIMLDYNSKYRFAGTDKPRGVGVHPHRGFETVTIAYQGKVAHHDSGGGGGVIAQGDVQWMTAASGVLHKEYHEKEWAKEGGPFQMVQLWVNLPARDKMSPPKYQAIQNNTIPKVTLDDAGSTVEVIAGTYQDTPGAASTFTPVNLLNARLKKGSAAGFSFPAPYNTALVVIEGSIVINGKNQAPTDHFVLMANDGESFTVEATDDAVVLVMSGEPIHEPIAAHGPFVMNTRQELIEAFEDFNQGKFGYLED